MKQYFLSILLFSLVIVSCTKEEPKTTGDFRLRFVLEYDGQPLVLNSVIPYEYDTYLKVSRFESYISSITLKSTSGDTVISDISYIDFSASNSTPAGATSGLSMDVPNLPVREFQTLEFGMGVNKLLNATKPAQYPSTHPLSNGANYWAGWDSYIFSKIEGKVSDSATGDFQTGFTYHTGMDPTYRKISLPINLKIDGEKTVNEIVVGIDVKKIFKNDQTALDILNETNAHGPGNQEIVDFLINNYSGAIYIKQ